MPAYYRGEHALLDEIAKGFEFYHGLLEQREFEGALTKTQQVEVLTALSSPGSTE